MNVPNQGYGPFESSARYDDHGAYWSAQYLAAKLGYDEFEGFRKRVINKSIGVCASLDISVLENFREEGASTAKTPADVRLSRFACYLVAMNADYRKPAVARAQAYFARVAAAVQQYVVDQDDVDRVVIRGDLSERERSLASAASSHGVREHSHFQNAGYRGMYNLSLPELKEKKGLRTPKRTLFDFMGKTELAANLFRVTQTEERIRNRGVFGQANLEAAAQAVGAAVRQTMIETSGNRPEDLPLSSDIRVVKSGLRATGRQFRKLDARSGGKLTHSSQPS